MFNWSKDAIEYLRSKWGRDGAKEIASALGTTKNSVVGKSHRLGLATLRTGQKSLSTLNHQQRQERANFLRREKRRMNFNITQPAFDIDNDWRAEAAAKAYEKVTGAPKPPLMLSIMQLTESTCRFPLDGCYCGHPIQEGSSYCGSHHRITHVGYGRG